MNSPERLAVVSGNPDASALIRLLKFVQYGTLESLQGGYSRRHSVVDHHGSIKIACGEHPRNVRQMGANLTAAGRVTRVIYLDLDRAAIRVKPEMMGGLLVRETHRLVAALIHPLVVVRHDGMLLRCLCPGYSGQVSRQAEAY